jgi:hypothetical protein
MMKFPPLALEREERMAAIEEVERQLQEAEGAVHVE